MVKLAEVVVIRFGTRSKESSFFSKAASLVRCHVVESRSRRSNMTTLPSCLANPRYTSSSRFRFPVNHLEYRNGPWYQHPYKSVICHPPPVPGSWDNRGANRS